MLRSDGTALRLTPRLSSALLLFVDHAGELVRPRHPDGPPLARPGRRREQLNQVVAGLRRALGDSAQGSRFIQTVPGADQVRRRVTPPAGVAPPAAPAGARQAPLLRWALVAGGSRRSAVRVGPGAASRQRRASGRRWPCCRSAAGRAGPRPAARSGHGRQPDRAFVDRARGSSGAADRIDAALRRPRAGTTARRASSGHLDKSTPRCSGADRLFAGHGAPARAADGRAAWSGSFEEAFDGVFAVQDQISDRVMQALAPPSVSAASAVPPLTEPGGTHSTGRLSAVSGGVATRRQRACRWPAPKRRRCSARRSRSTRPAAAWVGLVLGAAALVWNADALPSQAFVQSSERCSARRHRARPRVGARRGRDDPVLLRVRLAWCRARVAPPARDQPERGQRALGPGRCC